MRVFIHISSTVYISPVVLSNIIAKITIPVLTYVTTYRQAMNSKVSREAARNRGASLVAKAKELMRNQSHTNNNDGSARADEKVRLEIESSTPCFNLVQRWKDPNDWLEPSNYWKRTHPAMNFRLWSIVVMKPGIGWELRVSAERNLEHARRIFESKGGDSKGSRWAEEEEVLDGWALGFGGRDPPRSEWCR